MTDWRTFRALFPALERVVWLNTATLGPASRPVLDALRRVQSDWERGMVDWQAWEAEAHETRALFARLIGADASSVALVSSVAEAAATVARSLPPGRVVVGAPEFRSNLFPWLQLRQHGFEVVEVHPSFEEGVVRTDELARAIDASSAWPHSRATAQAASRTVLVAVSEVQSANGFRVRLADLVREARAVGARVFVDGTQSVGALRTDVRRLGVDFLAVHGYKWLCAPRGAAWLYVAPERLAEVEPLAPNWKSVADPYAEYYGGPLALAPDARRFDASLSWFTWVGARAALELLCSLDPAQVEARALGLARAFREAAARRRFALVPEEAPSQIVGVRVPDPESVRRRLESRSVFAAVRGGYLRVGFHAFNDETDLEAALAVLGSPD